VVEDYAPFRSFICSALTSEPGLCIVAEVSDGLEAVHKAEELQPDLILLDLGLPTLNGIEAARRIRKVFPESKILFLSQESAGDVVREALSVGALGYVVKAHAGSELLPAVKAIRQGNRFIGSGVTDLAFGENSEAQDSSSLHQEKALSSLACETGNIPGRHEVQFYPDNAAFAIGFADFIETVLRAGNAVIAIVTESHRKSLLRRLCDRGVDIGAAIEEGRYLPVDVDKFCSTFMAGDLPDPVRLQKNLGDLVVAAAQAAKGRPPRVAACGEIAPVLWAQGKADAAIRVEHLSDEVAKTSEIDILCGYVLKTFQRDQESDIRDKICAEHSTIAADGRVV
jgi:DNA-binding NarL/FixJ family response regulator